MPPTLNNFSWEPYKMSHSPQRNSIFFFINTIVCTFPFPLFIFLLPRISWLKWVITKFTMWNFNGLKQLLETMPFYRRVFCPIKTTIHDLVTDLNYLASKIMLHTSFQSLRVYFRRPIKTFTATNVLDCSERQG